MYEFGIVFNKIKTVFGINIENKNVNGILKRYRMIPIIVFLLLTEVLSAQNTSIDSLQLLISQAGIEDTTRIGYINSLSNKLWQKDIQQSNLLAREALEKSKKINYKKGMADALYNIGTIGFLQGRFMEAHQWLDYSIQIYGSISDKKGMASAIRNKAAVYSSQNNDTLALECSLKALGVFKELNDTECEAQIYNNLGILYDKQLIFDKALEYYYLTLKAMDSLEKGKVKGRAFVLNNIGINLNHQKQYEKAVTVLTNALTEARKDGNKQIESAVLSNLGLAYYNIGKVTRSLEYNIESIRLKEEMNDLQGLANVLGNLGNVYREMGLYHQAFVSYEKSMKYARDLGLKHIILSNQREMAKAYSKAGDFEKAYKLQEMALIGQDSLMQDEAKKRLGELQAQYEFEKKDQEISMLTYMKQKQEEKLTGNRFILYQVLILMIVLLVFISFMYKSYKQKVSVNIRLKEMNSNLESLVLEEVNKNRQKDLMLIQKDRQIAMGKMISSIAHQWRQPLNALGILLQNIETAYFSKELTDAYMQKKVEKANELIAFMSQTIDDFRDFFKPGKQKIIFSVKEVVEKSIAFLQAGLTKSEIKIKTHMEDGIMVYGHPNEYAQVVINIVNNASETLVERKIASPEIQIELNKLGNIVELGIKDNGGGISEEIIEKIFDPYYSVRPSGQGTGLGLYISQTIIEKHMQGEIRVKNINGGALFQIILKSA